MELPENELEAAFKPRTLGDKGFPAVLEVVADGDIVDFENDVQVHHVQVRQWINGSLEAEAVLMALPIRLSKEPLKQGEIVAYYGVNEFQKDGELRKYNLVRTLGVNANKVGETPAELSKLSPESLKAKLGSQTLAELDPVSVFVVTECEDYEVGTGSAKRTDIKAKILRVEDGEGAYRESDLLLPGRFRPRLKKLPVYGLYLGTKLGNKGFEYYDVEFLHPNDRRVINACLTYHTK